MPNAVKKINLKIENKMQSAFCNLAGLGNLGRGFRKPQLNTQHMLVKTIHIIAGKYGSANLLNGEIFNCCLQ